MKLIGIIIRVSLTYLDGEDWNDKVICSKKDRHQGPIQINLESIESTEDIAFFNFLENPNILSTLKYEMNGRFLVIQPMNENDYYGSYQANFYKEFDDFEEQYITSYFDSKCNKMYLKYPAEHQINGFNYDLEIQVFCSSIPLYVDTSSAKDTKISIMVKVINDEAKEEESQFFKEFDRVKIDSQFKINGLGEILNVFLSTKGIVYYNGTPDFPECNPLINYIVAVNNNFFINKEKLDNIISIVKTDYTKNGNNRKASLPSEDKGKNLLFYNNYSK